MKAEKLHSRCASRMAAATFAPTAISTRICPSVTPRDSVHSPVRKVNYAVEAARLVQMTDYEKLALKSGPMARSLRRCIGLASKLVKDHMSIFINFEEQPTCPRSVESYNDPRVEHWIVPSRNSNSPSVLTIA